MSKQETNPRLLKLTPNFALGEFLKENEPLPAPWILDNLYRLANRLQLLRDLLGKPVTITSGYRNETHNKQVGGHPKSYHMYGLAADIVVSGMPAHEVQKFLSNWHGGLGIYPTFTHVDIRPHKARWRG